MTDPEVKPGDAPVGDLTPAGEPKAEFSLPQLDWDKLEVVLKLLGSLPPKLEPLLKKIIASDRMPAKLKEIAGELEAVLELFQLLSDVFGTPVSELIADLAPTP